MSIKRKRGKHFAGWCREWEIADMRAYLRSLHRSNGKRVAT